VKKNKPIYLKAEIKLHEETDSRREAASVIELPKEDEKQIDLQYFSAVFVSSGANLNHAYFLPSELVKAEGTIINKAMDIEHNEDEIVGHIYNRAFTDKSGNKLETEELSSMEAASLDEQEMHIVIAGILYKNRFPNLAKEVADGKWCVSMEAYFRNYDVKVGEMIFSRPEAEALGLACDDSIFGRMAKVLKKGAEIASGEIDRVLRGITFSGCGFVKKPANPPSVILETASDKEKKNDEDEVIIIDYDKLDDPSTEEANNNVTSNNIEEASPNEEAELQYNDTVGICVNFKKEVYEQTFKDQSSTLVHTNWCTLYDKPCTSFSRDVTDPDCLRNQIRKTATSCVEEYMDRRNKDDRRKELLQRLKNLV